LYTNPGASASGSAKLTELCQRSEPNLTLNLTTHRLIFTDETTNPITVVYVPHSAIYLKRSLTSDDVKNGSSIGTGNLDPKLTVEKRNAHFGRSPKIAFQMKPEFLAVEVVVKIDTASGNADRDEIFDKVCRALGRGGWEKVSVSLFE